MAGITDTSRPAPHEQGVKAAGGPAVCVAVDSSMDKVLKVQASLLRRLSAALHPYLAGIRENEVEQCAGHMMALMQAIGICQVADAEALGGIDEFDFLGSPYRQVHEVVFGVLSEFAIPVTDEQLDAANDTRHFIAWGTEGGSNYCVSALVYKAAYNLADLVADMARGTR